MPTKRITKAEIDKYAHKSLGAWVKRLYEVKELKKSLPRVGDLAVDLSVCSAAEMAKINGEYRGKKKPTDVLSFPASEFFFAQGVLGDLVLCSDVLVAQAREQKHSWKKEVDVLLVHGLLHLLGFDHELGAREAKVMSGMELKLLKASKQKGLINRY